jgi:hypothetical protein
MNWKKAIGFGVLVWIVMFVVISAFVSYGITSGMTMTVVATAVSLVVAYVAARNIAPESYGMALWYGLVFAAVGIVLDFLISQRFAPGMFSNVSYWVNYLLVVLVPMLAVKKMPTQA